MLSFRSRPSDSVADPDPGSGAFSTPGSGMGKKQDPGSGYGINNHDHISESFWSNNFWVKILKLIDADPGSGINIPDPQRCSHRKCTVHPDS
jgi:hypothetical protein